MSVFTGARIRTNNVFGTTTDNPLASGATTMNSAGLANLDAVSSAHAVIVLDPLRSAGAPEIVIVTAHTGSATSATITRAAYGTSARSHASGTLWVHAETIDDLIRICTSGTRPSDQYEGQLIYETDTDSYKGHNGTAWEHGLTLGAWSTWTPSWTNVTVGNSTVVARYAIVARTVFYRLRFVRGSSGSISGTPVFSLPVASSSSYDNAFLDIIGEGLILDSGTALFKACAIWNNSTTAALQALQADATYLKTAAVSSTIPMTWTTNDGFEIVGTYEAAS